MLRASRSGILGKIAGDLDRDLARRRATGAPGEAVGRTLAKGDGWEVSDVLCTSGPRDRAFEEAHSGVSVAIVIAGSFEYRSSHGRHLMTPGSFMLGNPGECFECGHDHAAGDRCVSFHYEPEFYDRVLDGASGFQSSRIAPIRASSEVIAQTILALDSTPALSWEELAIDVADAASRLAGDTSRLNNTVTRDIRSHVTDCVRAIERDPSAPASLDALASAGGMSSFQFLRAFRALTGVTPHQFILRTRLRSAAARIADDDARIIDVALDAGFGDLSNFNHAFRAEFGATPSAFRDRARATRPLADNRFVSSLHRPDACAVGSD
jgi:AraC family transcriptional regulator